MQNIRRRLRDATQTDHQRLEGRLDIFSRIGTTGGRRDLARRFHRLHAGAERALAPHLGTMPGLDFEARRRTVRLADDLAALDVATLPAPADMDCDGPARALGVMYVLEGSTLGGKTIRLRIEAAGGEMTGLSFLDPYGDEGGARWRAFLEVLERETMRDEAAQACLAGALQGFRQAEAVLCAAEPALP